MKQYWPMCMYLRESFRPPHKVELQFTSNSSLSLERALEVIERWKESFKDSDCIMLCSWVQEYDENDNRLPDTEFKCYVPAEGIYVGGDFR